MSVTDKNKLIVKNTFLLYFRMFLTMAVSLFTARIVLQTLGVEDFGINNVVGGVVILFAFLNSTMAAATQRFLAFDLGKEDSIQLNNTFNVAMQVHLLIVLGIILLAETIGLWFILNRLVVPMERMDAALWVYQCAVIGLVIGVTQVPYTASIIAHENMKIFAYVSFLDVALRLLVVYLLYFVDCDKLKLYAVLQIIGTIISVSVTRIYCINHYKETKLRLLEFHPSIFKSMISYAGWNLSTHVALIARTQGINILINLFFGPSMNAARAISVSVNTAITSFVNNFQQAMNPRIIKCYAAGEIDAMNILLLKGSKYSFYLLFFLSFPAIMTMNYLLHLWLGNVPDYSLDFCRITLISALIDSISSVVGYGALATGNVKRYQLTISTVFIMVPMLTYWGYKLGYDAIFCFVSEMIAYTLVVFFRPYLLSKLIDFSLIQYFKSVILPSFMVVLTTLPLAWLIVKYICVDSLISCFLVVVLCAFYSLIAIFIVGLDKAEKKWILNKIAIKKIFS